jgi:hypothetical protein
MSVYGKFILDFASLELIPMVVIMYFTSSTFALAHLVSWEVISSWHLGKSVADRPIRVMGHIVGGLAPEKNHV